MLESVDRMTEENASLLEFDEREQQPMEVEVEQAWQEEAVVVPLTSLSRASALSSSVLSGAQHQLGCLRHGVGT